MRCVLRLAAAAVAVAVTSTATSALADFSACESALRTEDLQQQIALYTTCITQGGLPIRGRMGAYNNRGVAYERRGDLDNALKDFTSGIESDPYWATSYVNRGRLYESRGEVAKALADFDKAIQVGPAQASLPAYHAEVWLLATSRDPAIRDGPKAVRVALKAVRFVESPSVRDALAVAYAAVGQFDDAVREETKAIALAQAKRPPEDTDEFQARLDLYRKGVPYLN